MIYNERLTVAQFNGLPTEERGAVFAEDTLTLTTVSREECYKPNIGIEEAQKTINVYYDSAATVPVVIENKGSVAAEYLLGISGTAANFAQLNPATIKVEPNKAEIVYLYVALLKPHIYGHSGNITRAKL